MSTPATPAYKKLPGGGRRGETGSVGVASRNLLYLGDDHLLSLDRSAGRETYKRFYFRDIRAITLQKTARFLVWTIVLLVLLLLVGWLTWLWYSSSFSGDDGTAALITGGFFGGLLLLGFIINLVRGPTCLCRLKTAVQIEVLPALGRLRNARRALATLQPLIQEAQSGLAEEASVRPAEADSPTVVVRPVRPRTPSQPPPVAVVGSPRLHWLVFGTLALAGAADFIDTGLEINAISTMMTSAFLLIPTLACPFAIAEHRDRFTLPSTRTLTVISFVYLALLYLALTGFLQVAAAAAARPGRIVQVSAFDRLDALDEFPVVVFIKAAIEAALGIFGLMSTARSRQFYHALQTPPAAGAVNAGPPPVPAAQAPTQSEEH